MNEVYIGIACENSLFGLRGTLDLVSIPVFCPAGRLCGVLQHALCCSEGTAGANWVSVHLGIVCSSRAVDGKVFIRAHQNRQNRGKKLGWESRWKDDKNNVHPNLLFTFLFRRGWGGVEGFIQG